jgi:hypothetical protein
MLTKYCMPCQAGKAASVVLEKRHTALASSDRASGTGELQCERGAGQLRHGLGHAARGHPVAGDLHDVGHVGVEGYEGRHPATSSLVVKSRIWPAED